MRTPLRLAPLAVLAVACSDSAPPKNVAVVKSDDAPFVVETSSTDDPLSCAIDENGMSSCGDPMNIDPTRHFGHDPRFAKGKIPVDTETFHCGFCEEIGRNDSCAGATQGAVWYGLWEDAVAESERTGKPLLIHLGSPRHLRVCGVW